MRYFHLAAILMFAVALTPVQAATHSKKSANQAQAKMSDDEVRQKCISDFQKNTGSTGPNGPEQLNTNNRLYQACVHKYGVRP